MERAEYEARARGIAKAAGMIEVPARTLYNQRFIQEGSELFVCIETPKREYFVKGIVLTFAIPIMRFTLWFNFEEGEDGPSWFKPPVFDEEMEEFIIQLAFRWLSENVEWGSANSYLETFQIRLSAHEYLEWKLKNKKSGDLCNKLEDVSVERAFCEIRRLIGGWNKRSAPQ